MTDTTILTGLVGSAAEGNALMRRNEVYKLPDPDNCVESIYYLLTTHNPYYRAAAILLLREFATYLVANGKGEWASRIVQTMRDEDPRHSARRDGKLHP